METDEILLEFFDLLIPSVPFYYTPWNAHKILSGVMKKEYWEEISEQELQKENKEFLI